MKQVVKLFLFALSIGVLLISCVKDEGPTILGDYENGFFIVNEGPFSSGYGTLTYVSNDYETVEQEVFNTVNEEVLGSIVQSMEMYGEKAYIIVNNSHKLVVANRYTMEKEGEIIEGLNNPRYIVFSGGKGFISNWGSASDTTDDYIAVLDLNSLQIINTISVSEGPEHMYVKDNSVYVALKGGWGYNNEVVKINASTESVEINYSVGYLPDSFVEMNNDLLVLCSGKSSWTGDETAGGIYNLSENVATTIVEFDITEHPTNLVSNGSSSYYFLNGNVYQWDGTSTLPTNAISNFAGYYYGIQISLDKLFAFDAGDYSSNGTLKIFDLGSESLEQEISAGIIPNNVAFNY
jgi:hypothetical protein